MNLLRTVAVLAFVAAMACGGSMTNVKSAAKSGACEAGCDTAKTECVDKCAGDKDSAACELACDVARDKCAEDCKS